jgi:hypothetical protein
MKTLPIEVKDGVLRLSADADIIPVRRNPRFEGPS